jgi:hypothetical protein
VGPKNEPASNQKTFSKVAIIRVVIYTYNFLPPVKYQDEGIEGNLSDKI